MYVFWAACYLLIQLPLKSLANKCCDVRPLDHFHQVATDSSYELASYMKYNILLKQAPDSKHM